VLTAGIVAAIIAAGGARAVSPPSAGDGAAPAESQIRHNWLAFFSGATPPAKKVRLLQNGQRFAAVIEAQAKSPLATQVHATVRSVTLKGKARATVRYTITLAGKPVLENQTGEAVRSHGTWQVGYRSFCALLALQGATPPACRSG
jgi:hypothetical protein